MVCIENDWLRANFTQTKTITFDSLGLVQKYEWFKANFEQFLQPGQKLTLFQAIFLTVWTS